jgi:hypothetical protein
MTRQRHIIRIIPILCFGQPLLASAATSAYWSFQDQAPGVLATTVVSAVHGDVLVGQAKNTGGSARSPSHDADAPGTNIFDGLYGMLLNSNNTASLYFTNAAAYPAQTNSQNGGYVEVTNVTSLLCPTNFTLEFFVKTARPVNWPCLVGKARDGGASWCIDTPPDGTVKLRMDTQPLNQPGTTNGFNQSLSGPNIQDGAWHHMAISYSSPSRLATMYVDYVSKGTLTTTHEVVYTNFSLFMGKGAGSNQAFDGWLDEVRLSDTVLQPNQFLHTFSVPENAQLYYTFDDAATVPSTATTLVSEAYSPTMNGTAKVVGSATIKPAFSADIPPAATTRITQGYKGTVVNQENRSSLFFVNAGLPTVGSSNGGQVSLPGYLHPSNFTVEAFIKMRGDPSYPLIVGKVRYGSYPTWSLSVSGAKIRCRFDTFPDGAAGDYAQGYNQGFSTGVTVTNGLWHHVAFSYETATKNVKIYVDYERKVNSTTINPIVYTDGDIVIGNGAGECAFDGWIDEVRITPRLLGPDEFLYTMPRHGTLITFE